MGGVGLVLPSAARGLPQRRRHPVRRLRRRRAARPGPVQPRRLPRPADPGVAAGACPASARPAVPPGCPRARPRLRRRLVVHRAGRRRTPASRCSAIDSDDASVMDARANAAAAGLADRVRFEVADAAAPPRRGRRTTWRSTSRRCTTWPTRSSRWPPCGGAAARRVRRGGRRAGRGGVRAGRQRGRARARDLQRAALPAGRRSQPGSEGTGALFRPSTMREYAARAGYSEVEVAPVEHDMFRFFVLRPSLMPPPFQVPDRGRESLQWLGAPGADLVPSRPAGTDRTPSSTSWPPRSATSWCGPARATGGHLGPEPRRGRADHGHPPGLRLPARPDRLRHRPPGLRAQAADRPAGRLRQAAPGGRLSAATPARPSPSTTSSRTPTPPPRCPTPTGWPRPTRSAARTGTWSRSSATAR